MPRRFLFILLLAVVVASCGQKKKSLTSRSDPIEIEPEQHFLINSAGDTIPAGVPIPAKGKRIDPDSVAKPKTVPLRRAPKVVPAYLNEHPTGTPKIVALSEALTVITPGKGGVPLPETVPALGKVVYAKQPKPVPALPPRMKEGADYTIQYLDVDQGMISSYIYTMLEDRRGNIWFGTLDGLSRYDGQSLTHFTTEEGLSHDMVWSMLEDSRGNLWFGTVFGLTRYDGQRFTQYSTEDGLMHNYIMSMLEDSHGNLWFGTEGGASRYDPDANNGLGRFTQYTTKEGLTHNVIWSLLEDSRGNLWFGTEGGANRYDPDANNGLGSFTQYTTKEGLTHNAVRSLLEDSRGNIWFGTAGGANCFDPEAGGGRGAITQYTTEEGLTHNFILSIMEDSHGDLWFGTDGGASRYSPSGSDQDIRGPDSFSHYTTEEGLSYNVVWSMLEDSGGNLWFGTAGGGANYYDKQSFIYFTKEAGLSHNFTTTMLEDSRGDLWFGTIEGVNRYTPDANNGQGSFTYFTTEEGLSHNGIWSMLEDSRGNLWIATDGGVSCYSPDANNGQGSFTHYTTEEGLSNNFIRSMLEDSRGNIWFGTEGGATCYDPDANGGRDNFTHYTTKEGLCNNLILCMLKDRRENIWFGTEGGVSCYDHPDGDQDNGDQGSFTHYTFGESRSENIIMSILEDTRGNIWFGTEAGVRRYNPDANGGRGSFTHYTTTDGLNHNIVLSILEDNGGNLWMSTRRGIVLFIPPHGEPSVVSDSEAGVYQIFSFGKADGLKRLDLGFKNACLDRHNRLWWGSQDGLTLLDLKEFELPTEPPKNIQLNHVEINQQFVDYRRLTDTAYHNSLTFGEGLPYSFDSVAAFYNYTDKMTLSYQLNDLTFHFSALDWAAPHKVRYSILMKGMDEEWSLPNNEVKAEYRNLPPGDYTFQVKAIGAAQVWSEPFEYSFTIRPPWYWAWWSKTFYLLVFFGSIYALYRFQLNRRLARAETRRLRELDAVKTKLYTNITHEFRTPLTVILGMADQIKGQVSESAKEGLSMIRRNGRQLLGLVNQLLDLRKLESGTMPVNLVQGDILLYLKYILESFHSYAESNNVRLHFHSGLQTLVMDYDPEKILTILSNLLSNAIKFTPEGGDVYLTVNGGRPPAHQAKPMAGQTADGNGGPSFITHHSSLMIKVKDTGIGISQEKLPHIFDRFYQIDDEATRKAEGTGIGLALTKELVKLMGGEISVKSELGKGTEFRIFLPISQEAEPLEKIDPIEAVETVETGEVALLTSLSEPSAVEDQPLVLAIEDNADVRNYLQSCLGAAYRLQMAEEGQQGINRALEYIPDLIISDVMMPGKDGFEVCDALKNDERTSHIPIILLTAKADIESRLSGLKRGADAYLAKPFDKEELLVRMAALIEQRRRLQAYYLSQAVGGEVKPPKEKLAEAYNTDNAFVQKVREIIEAHLDDAGFSVEQLSREAALSQTQLFRKLKALVGKSAVELIRSIRLAKARELLRDPDLSITAVAFDTGFNDPLYFSKVFRKEFGVSPSEFREGE